MKAYLIHYPSQKRTNVWVDAEGRIPKDLPVDAVVKELRWGSFDVGLIRGAVMHPENLNKEDE